MSKIEEKLKDIRREFGIRFSSKEIGKKDTAKVYADPKDITDWYTQKITQLLEEKEREVRERVLYQFRIVEEMKKMDETHCGCMPYVENLIKELE